MKTTHSQPGDPQALAERTFTDEDQLWFAQMSGDRNPVHLDAIAARRLLTGRPIVHGVHVLLWALEYWRADGAPAVTQISASFDNPVGVGETVCFSQRIDARGRTVVTASVDDLVCVRTVITTRSPGEPRATGSAAAPTLRGDVHRIDKIDRPLDQSPESHLEKVYAITPDDRGLSAFFPQSRRILGEHGPPSVAALSYFAGMIAPGLHSVLSSVTLDLTVPAAADRSLRLWIRNFHSNVRLFDIAFEGAMTGRLEAFLRPSPSRQPSIKDLSSVIGGEEFRGTRSLIIGGSRGLGEMTAKVLGAGAGDVVLTYHAGAKEARAIKDELDQHRAGSCETVCFDVRQGAWQDLRVDLTQIDAVYFFPTPRIFRKSARIFNPAWFREFSTFYVDSFFELCAHLERRAVKPVRVFFPSSVAVVERPKGLTEYAMAKAAAEVMIEDINRSFKRVSVRSHRLPRLNTDQTASVLDVAAESNVDTLLPIIRSMYQ